MKFDLPRTPGRLIRLFGCALLTGWLAAAPAHADLLPPMKSATTFFTNVATRLLRDEGLPTPDRIQLWPTNHYTPAVHRLLQLTANLCDARSPSSDLPGFPTVFRPVFTNTGAAVFITGFVEETGTNVLAAAVRDLSVAGDRAALQPMDLVQGIPLVLGARKGFPNFNEFALQTVAQMQRKLELRRPNPSAFPNETNQMYYLSVSNLFGLEAWNSYAAAYPRPLEMRIAIGLTWTLTNEVGVLWQTNYTFPPNGQAWYTFPLIASNGWAGSPLNAASGGYADTSSSTNALRVPVSGGLLVLTNSAYVQNPAGGGVFISASTPFPRTGLFPIPKIWLTIAARVRYALVDAQENRLVDFVNLANLDRTLDLSGELMATYAGDEPASIAQQWRTNRIGGSTVYFPTEGVVSQMRVSLGNLQTSLSEWTSYGGNTGNVRDKEKAIDAIRVFWGLTPISSDGQLNPPIITNLVIQTPFNPTRKLSLATTWQANDPLVHYQPGDLSRLFPTGEIEFVTPPNQPPARLLANLGRLNPRTLPWGGNSSTSLDSNKYNLALKDPLIRRSDGWDFPTNAPLTLATLSRVHRGTPWQTISLKATNASLSVWQNWTGNADPHDASLTQPSRDWHLAELWLAWTQTDYASLLSINDRDPEHWLAALGGIETLTNTWTDAEFNNPYLQPRFASLTMTADSPQAATLAQAIATRRAASPDGVFHSLAEIVAVPELSLASPWLHVSAVQQQRGLTDAAYEALPAQLLPRLRPELLTLRRLGENACRLTVAGFPDATCIVEHSSDLQSWQPVATNRLNHGTMLLDLSLQDAESQYFRSWVAP